MTVNAGFGAGSFREAIAAANGNPGIARISFAKGLGTIAVAEPVVFTGSQALTIDGQGTVLDGSSLPASASILVVAGGGDLDVRDLTLQNAPGSGLEVQVPGASTGILRYALTGVSALNNGLHGVEINDQVDPTSTEPPVRPNSAGSPASLVVRVSHSRFEGNGFGAGDQDGLRVNEGGAGSLDVEIKHSLVLANGGDGVELDERGPGDVVLSVQHTDFLRNGALDPDDLDDGLDVDELDEGHVLGRFVQVRANDNFEEGIDINENDAGDMRIEMGQVEASRNREEGVDLEEDDDFQGGGDLIATLAGVTADGNTTDDGDAGIKIRERGTGNLVAIVEKPQGSGNSAAGISLREDADGDLQAQIFNALANGNGGHGIIYDENGAGNLTALLSAATASNNGGAGVRAEQGTPGAGALTIQALTANGNAGGAVSNNSAVIVMVVP